MAEQALEQYEDNWQTSMGGMVFDSGLVERVLIRDRNIFTELRDKTWMEFLLFAVTGRDDSKLARLIEAIWVICSSYPDPRLWNNRIAAMAGTVRSTCHLAMAGATAVTEASIYGGQPILKIADFLFRTCKQQRRGESLHDLLDTELSQAGRIPGFGRPGFGEDERIQPLLDCSEKMLISRGEHTELVFTISEYIQREKRKLQPNIAALLSGLLLDQNLSPREIYHLYVFGFSGGFLPCYLDAQVKPIGALFPLRCNRIKYSGAAPRPWAR